MKKKYVVSLTRRQRDELRRMVSSGDGPARRLTRARILLKADGGDGGLGWGDLEISQALDVGTATVFRVRKRFCERGLKVALSRQPSRRAYARKLDARAEAQLVDLVNRHVPVGHRRWTLRLLAERLTTMNSGHGVSHETVRQVLLRANVRLSPVAAAGEPAAGA